jgi:hypothetical protein
LAERRTNEGVAFPRQKERLMELVIRLSKRATLNQVIAAALLCLPVSALAAGPTVRFMTAGELFSKLSSPLPEEVISGHSYVMGVVDGLTLAKDLRVCMRPDIEIRQVAALVREQLASRPDIHRFNAASVIRETMAVELPCRLS